MRKITAILITAIVVIVAVLAMTKAGHVIDAATQHFMLYYAGVLALVGLTGAVLVSLLAADRIVMTPGHRVMAQAVHRAFAFGTLAFLVIHIVTEILAQRSHVIDSFIPFLSPYRTFYIGLGTIASDLIVLLVVTGILRNRYTAHGKAWRWRAIHYTSYVAFVFGVLHGLLGGRAAKPYVDWSYGFAIALTALGLAVRFLAISLRPKESLAPAPGVDRPGSPRTSPLRAAAMTMAQAQLGGTMGGTVQVLPAGLGARGAPGTDSWAALPAPGWSAASGPLPALGPAPASTRSFSDAYAELGFTPLGAPPYGDDLRTQRHRPYVSADQPRPALAGPAPAAARQPLYEPGYDGPPRFAGAPRGQGDVPQDELSSYPYGPGRRGPQSAAPYPGDHAGRDGWAESPRPRAALPAPPRQGSRGSGPQPALGADPAGPAGPGPMLRPGTGPTGSPGTGPLPRAATGPIPRAATGPIPRADTGPLPRPDVGAPPGLDTGPVSRGRHSQRPRSATGPQPRPGTGPMPQPDVGPAARPGTGPMPRLESGPMPRLDTGPMPRLDTGPMPRPESGPAARPGTGPIPRADTGPLPRAAIGPGPRPDTGPAPRGGQRPRHGTGPLPRAGTGPMPRPDTGPLARATGPASRVGTGPMAHPGTGPMPRPGQPAPPADPRTGPPPWAAQPSRRTRTNDPGYHDRPGPTGGDKRR